MPKLSIIVPVYNTEKFLVGCIDSICNQTFRDYEVILVDDGSSDNSLRICLGYAARYPSIKTVTKEHAGLVAARKTGVAGAVGEYIGFVDSDDTIDSEMYFEMMHAAEAYDADIVHCSLKYCSKESIRNKKCRLPSGLYSPLERPFLDTFMSTGNNSEHCVLPSLCTKIIKRELLAKCLRDVPDEIRMGEDVAVSYPCIFNADRVVLLSEKYFYNYFQHPASMSHSYKSDYVHRFSLVIYFLEKSLLQASDRIAEKKLQVIRGQISNLCAYYAIDSIKNEIRFGKLLNLQKVFNEFRNDPFIALEIKRSMVQTFRKRDRGILLFLKLWLSIFA
jgi:glycosyltransferase involved in cell wall biosynthesis